MRVLMIVQLVDEREWLRAFTVGWIRALAARVERLDVLTLEMGEAELPDNVFVQSMGKEKCYNRARELVEFYRGLGRVIRDVDVIFSHMTPRYTWLAAPLAAAYRKPQMLWFTHRQISPELRLALGAVRWITTASADSFPLPGPKVHVMGHGIDIEKYAPGDPPRDQPPMVLAVGRMAPIKHHHTLLEAAALLRDRYGNPPVHFAISGGTAASGDEEYQQKLIRRRAELGLSEEQFALLGAQPSCYQISLYRRASVVTNLSPVGLFDKSALEAMLTGTPIIASSPAFDSLFGNYHDQLRINGPDDAAGLAARLAALLALPSETRAEMGRDLRARTAAEHSLDRLMDHMVTLMQESSRS